MYLLFCLLLLTTSLPAYTQESISFKKNMIANTHWSPYVLIFLFLCTVLILLARHANKTTKRGLNNKVMKCIAKHHKISIFIIDYKGQQFLLAENPNALKLHPLTESVTHETC